MSQNTDPADGSGTSSFAQATRGELILGLEYLVLTPVRSHAPSAASLTVTSSGTDSQAGGGTSAKPVEEGAPEQSRQDGK